MDNDLMNSSIFQTTLKPNSWAFASVVSWGDKDNSEGIAIDKMGANKLTHFRLSEDRMKNSLNLEIQFLLKQGQVEVEVGEFVPNFQDSILLHRPVVEDLNATIKVWHHLTRYILWALMILWWLGYSKTELKCRPR